MDRVSVPLWGTFLSEPLPIDGTVGRYPAVCLMGREPIRNHRSFQQRTMRPAVIWGIRRRFRRLYPGPGHVAHALRTPLPVAAGCIAAPALPLDLHVLSLPLAFILSQDQTLLGIKKIIPQSLLSRHPSFVKKSTLSFTISRYLLVLPSVFSMISLKNPIRQPDGIAKVQTFFEPQKKSSLFFKLASIR